MERVLDALAAGATVVSANNRLARSIRLAFDRRQRAAGLRAWRTPAVLPWSAWITSLWESSATGGGSAGQLFLLDDFQCRLLWRDVAAAPDAVGDLAAGAWRLAQDWRLGPDDLARAADSDDAATFAQWAADYVTRCRELGFADGATVVPRLLADVRRGSVALPERLHFVGFEAWTPLERSLIEGIATPERAVVEEPPPAPAPGRRVRIAYPDRLAELDGAARWARARMEAQPSSSVAIVVPDLAARLGEVRRAVLDVMAPAWRLAPDEEWPVNFSYARPLADHGLVHAALAVLRLLAGSTSVAEAGELLRTPYVGGHDDERAARARLDLALRERIGADIGVRELADRARRDAPLLARALDGLWRLAEAAPSRASASAWADTFRLALVALGWPGGRPLGSDEHQAATACEGLWDGLRGCERLTGRLTLAGALRLLQELARARTFQPAGHAGGVQVLGTLEAVGQRFDATWVCGMTGNAWPAASRPSPLIGLGLQRELAMPDSSPASARERAERHLRWLEASAPEFVASWPRFSGEQPFTASPLIAHLAAGELADVARWPGEGWREAMASAPRAVPIAGDAPPPVAAGSRVRGGAGLLARQATCPARAFLEFRLGARELRVPASGIDASTRGSVVHAVLEALYARPGGHDELASLTPAEESALLDALIAAAIDARIPRGDPVLSRLGQFEARRLKPLLGEFLAGERARSRFVVKAVEEMPAGARLPPALAALQIRVRPDRVDLMPDGGLLVIDYKTGRALPGFAELHGPRPRAPQLPLYAVLLGARGLAFVHVAATGIAWRGIGPAQWELPGVVEADKATRGEVADWDSLRAAWWSAFNRLAEEILAGSFDVERWHHDDARGQWAMATRICELADDDADRAS